MQRVESIKSGIVADARKEEDPSELRDPDAVNHELTDERDGAWAEGKAPITMITEFLSLLEDEETAPAIELAQKILHFEPNNIVVKNLFKALQLKLVVDQHESQGEESTSSSEEDSEESSEEEHTDDGETMETSDAKDVEL
ncbi:hypothetical protein LEN26_015952 [Aphanomyces euteiches]|nr:hypothetical protein LEN26_015952 [Aphanomyces euteiches]KAH9113235.1 hypothetical protein AeMF1_012508 [Aphanomyces euteiches]KAH9197890.1 hypothetical protein AeNC1_000167 [Aphanomyces euteiches]